jgi:hypothetical protein
MKRFDGDGDEQLSFWEFSNMLLPIDSVSRYEVERRRTSWDLSEGTQNLIRDLMVKTLENEDKIESIRL